jgi:hypothetical protein
MFPAIAMVVVAVVVAGAQAKDPRRDPATAVQEAIRLIETKNYVALLKTFAMPEELERLTRTTTLEAAAADFGRDRASRILEALKAAAKLKPTLNEDGTRADFLFETPVGGERRIRLQKVGEFWYLR